MMQVVRGLVRGRSVAYPGDREQLADMMLDLGREDMALAIRSGRPWRSFLDGTVIAVQPEREGRGQTLGTWIDGQPIQWQAEGPWGRCSYITQGEGRDERPVELRWEMADQSAILALAEALTQEAS